MPGTMISLFPFVFLFTFVTCKTFHPNQHLPVQKYQPPLRYQPLQYYPTYPTAASLPYYRPSSPTKEGPIAPSNSQDISDLERQYQQWQISSPNGQQPGVIWISAPQYSYYPPPPNGSPPNYPPPPYYPSPYPSPYPAPYPLPTPESNQTQPEIQEVNPTQSRETVPTKPSPSETTSVDSSTTSENFTTSTETFSTYPPSTYSPTPSTTTTTEVPWTASPTPTDPPTENYTITYFTTAPTNATTTTEITTNATTTTEIPTTTTPSYTASSTTTENATITTTTSTPNTTSNATNPLLKYCKKPRGQFPSEDCSKFVNCWDDTAVEQTCPSGLYFNANKSYCDYPSNVNCTGSSSSTESTTSSSSLPPSSNTTSSKCPSSYGTYRNSSNCAAFYVCVAGEPVDFYCPPGTNYNDELKVCDYPYRVNCSGIPSYPIPEESGTTIATETTPSNFTTETPFNVTTTSPNVTTSSPNVTTATPNVTTSSPNVTTSSPNVTTTSSPNATSSPIIVTTTTTTTEENTSTIVAPQVTEEPFPSVPPPSVDPVAIYNLNLKKLPESVVNTGVRCYHTNVFRLTPDCSSVTVCQDGLTYIVNCGHDTSFDAYSQKCVSSFRARC